MKLCPTHNQPYIGGVCQLCEQSMGGSVDWKAECRRLNAKVAKLEFENRGLRRVSPSRNFAALWDDFQRQGDELAAAVAERDEARRQWREVLTRYNRLAQEVQREREARDG